MNGSRIAVQEGSNRPARDIREAAGNFGTGWHLEGEMHAACRPGKAATEGMRLPAP